MTNAYASPPRPTSRQVGIRLPPEILERIEKYRQRLNEERVEGAPIVDTSTAIRNLLLRALGLADADDAGEYAKTRRPK